MAGDQTTPTGQVERALFHNPALDRRLDDKAVQAILEYMVSADKAIWDKGRASAIILWKSVPAWSESIDAFVQRSGRARSVMTLFELTEGDEVVVGQEDFRGLDHVLLRKALEILVKAGKAAWIKDGSGSIEGIKFF